MALLESLNIPCSLKGATGITIERHDNVGSEIRFTDPETLTTKTCALSLANLSKLFAAIREPGLPRLSNITFA